jgi:hypothetical protein
MGMPERKKILRGGVNFAQNCARLRNSPGVLACPGDPPLIRGKSFGLKCFDLI